MTEHTDNKKSTIDYTSRDFDTIKQDLIEFVKRYYPDTFRDFNEASFGMTMLDSVAYIGDMLSFYLDYEVNESFLDTAVEFDNVLEHAKQHGYELNPNPSARGEISLYILVPTNNVGNGPDASYLPILRKGSSFSTQAGNRFLLTEDVDFSVQNELVVARTNEETGLPTQFAVKKKANVVSGEIKQESINIGAFERFKRVQLKSRRVTEIISVTDTDGHRYYQVPSLTQNYIFKSVLSNKTFEDDVSVERSEKITVPRRFVLEREEGNAYLQFGYGSEQEEGPVDPSKVALDTIGREFVSDTSFDPTKILDSDSLGIAPSNTVLNVRYRTNSTNDVNAAVDELTNVVSPIFKFDNPDSLNEADRQTVVESLEVSNERPITGDVSVPSVEEIKRRAKGMNTSQDRAVTTDDYENLVYSMPSKFGGVKRCSAVPDKDSLKRNINLYVIGENANRSLTELNQTIKENIKEWIAQKKMVNDTVDIHDAFIVNFGVEYLLVSEMDQDKFQVLQRAQAKLVNYFETHYNIGEDIHITEVYNNLNDVDGVADVADIRFSRKSGTGYANTKYNLQNNKTSDGRFIHAPKNIVFEVKNFAADLNGSIK